MVGTINIETEVGRGTSFVIRIPVNLSLLPVVLVNINGLHYAIPNQSVLEIRHATLEQVRSNAGRDYVAFRGKQVPCIDLRERVKTRTKSHEEKLRECALVFFEADGKTFAARVSELERNTELMVKSMPAYAPKIDWISGVSVLPTGEPVFIFSLSRLIDEENRNGGMHHAA